MVDSTPNKPEPTSVQQFFSRLGKDYKDKADQQEIGNLLSQYQQNRQDGNALEDLWIGLEKSTVGPTKRLEAQETIKQMADTVQKRDKSLNDQAKKMQDEVSKKKTNEALRKGGATEEQIDLYEAASVGGQTAIMKDILDDIARNKTPPGLISNDAKDFDKGLTPNQRVERQEKRYTVQTPIVMKNSESLSALKGEENSINLLSELDKTDKIGEGIHNLNINPLNGNLIIPKLATREEALFVKTVNDFSVKAKDSFGANVTNFELDRFMQRLPGLANNKESRKLILRQMKIVNQINQLEKSAIQRVFDKYGVRNIDYAEAENMARTEINDQKESLKAEYLNLENVARKDEMEMANNIKERVKEGYTAMRKPDGTIKQFPTKNVSNLEEKGYKKL